MKVYVSACVVLAFCVTMSLQDISPFLCKDGPTPEWIQVKGYNKSLCEIRIGQDLIADCWFIARNNVKKLKPLVQVKIEGETIDFPYPQPDACKSLSKGQCPLKKFEEAWYNLKIPISEIYPPVKLRLEFSLLDENEKIQVCFGLNLKVVN